MVLIFQTPGRGKRNFLPTIDASDELLAESVSMIATNGSHSSGGTM
jgi:hypothetical protein